MTEPIAYFCGQYVPASQARLALDDLGFVYGATVVERLRTFRGKLFRLPEHLARFARSLEITGITLAADLDVGAIAERVAQANAALLPEGGELGMAIFATPGRLGWHDVGPEVGPTLGVHTYRLPLARWAELYRTGVALRTVSVEQPALSCWPAELKCRSRMHYYLADRQASAAEPGAMALLCDASGDVTETSQANVAASLDGRTIVSPPRARILPGVSLAATQELAGQLGLEWVERPLTPHDLTTAREAWLMGTSWCLLPVARFNGAPVGKGAPGELYGKLLQEWSRLVGVRLGDA